MTRHTLSSRTILDALTEMLQRQGRGRGAVHISSTVGSLVVDRAGNERSLDETAETDFSQTEHLRCLVAADGDEAVEHLARQASTAPDVVLVEMGHWKTTRALFDCGYLLDSNETLNARSGRAYLRSDLVASVAGLGQGSRGIAAMSNLGRNGRFGNQLFQYAFLKLYALRHELTVATPEWMGRDLFGLDDKTSESLELKPLNFFAFDDDDLALWTIEEPPIDVDFSGYFQELPRCWRRHRSILRRLFTPVGDVQSALDACIAGLTHDGRRPLVALHIRRGDYQSLFEKGLDWYAPIPIGWYADWLASQHDVADAVLYLATDAFDDKFDELRQWSLQRAADLRHDETVPLDIIDFEILRRADRLALANSSFSRMASLLADEDQQASLPDFGESRFVPYDSWLDGQFWRKYDTLRTASEGFGSSIDAVRTRSMQLHIEVSAKTHFLEQQGKALRDQSAAIIEYEQRIGDFVAELDATRASHQLETERLQGLLRELELRLAAARRDAVALRYAVEQSMVKEPDRSAERERDELRIRLQKTEAALSEALFLGSPAGLARRIAFRPAIVALRAMRVASKSVNATWSLKFRDDEQLLIDRKYRAWTELLRSRGRRLLARSKRQDLGSVPQHRVTGEVTSNPGAIQDLMSRSEHSEISGTSRLPHVLVVLPWLVMGGSEVLLLKILTALRHEATISIITALHAEHAMEAHFREVASEIHLLDGLFGEGAFGDFVTNYCRTRQVTKIFSSNCALAYKVAPRLKSEIDGLQIVDLLHNDLKAGHFSSALEAASSIDTQIVVSERIQTSLREAGWTGAEIHVIPNGVDMHHFDATQVSKGDSRKALGLSVDEFIVGFVGRMSHEKRPGAFLEIIRTLRISGLRAVLVGSGPLTQEVEEIIQNMDCPVTWFDHLDPQAMHTIYSALDVLVLTSTIEGMPLTILEGMAMQVPVAATDVGNIASLIEPGVTGFIVPAERYLDIADHIETLHRDGERRHAIGAAGRNRLVEKGLTQSEMLERYKALLLVPGPAFIARTMPDAS